MDTLQPLEEAAQSPFKTLFSSFFPYNNSTQGHKSLETKFELPIAHSDTLKHTEAFTALAWYKFSCSLSPGSTPQTERQEKVSPLQRLPSGTSSRRHGALMYILHTYFFLLFPREICVTKKNKNTLAATKTYHCNMRASLASASVILPLRPQLLSTSCRQKQYTPSPPKTKTLSELSH